MRLMTYISPRESPYGGSLLCVRHYTRYIIIVAHGKSCARACVCAGGIPARPSSSLRGSSHPPSFPPPPGPSLTVSLYYSRYPPQPRLSPPCRVLRYRESFRVRLRATDYRNQAVSGSGISTANYNHRFLYPVRHFLVFMPLRYGPADVRTNGSRRDRGKACHSVAHTRDLCQFTIHRKRERYVAKPRAEIITITLDCCEDVG